MLSHKKINLNKDHTLSSIVKVKGFKKFTKKIQWISKTLLKVVIPLLSKNNLNKFKEFKKKGSNPKLSSLTDVGERRN